MESRVLIAYPAGDGPARAVADAVAEALADAAITADTVASECAADLARYGAAVLVARLDRPLPAVPGAGQPSRPGRLLPVAVLALGCPGLDEDARAASVGRLERALAAVPWMKPVAVEAFCTALHREPHSPPSPIPAVDLRDWETIRHWAHTLPGLLRLPVPVG